MSKLIFLVFALLLACSAAGLDYDVYIIAGQSNADGRGRAGELKAEQMWPDIPAGTLISYANPAKPGAEGEIAFRTGFEPLRPGYSVPPKRSKTAKVPSADYFGPEMSFAAAIGPATGSTNPLILIKVTRGGTNLREDWRAADDPERAGFMYRMLIEQVTASLQALEQDGHSATLRGLVWHQGESDRKRKDYTANLEALITAVRREFDADLPFVVGELSRDREENANFNRNLARFVDDPARVNLAIVSSADLTTTDRTHFDSVSQVALGKRYAAAMGELLVD